MELFFLPSSKTKHTNLLFAVLDGSSYSISLGCVSKYYAPNLKGKAVRCGNICLGASWKATQQTSLDLCCYLLHAPTHAAQSGPGARMNEEPQLGGHGTSDDLLIVGWETRHPSHRNIVLKQSQDTFVAQVTLRSALATLY